MAHSGAAVVFTLSLSANAKEINEAINEISTRKEQNKI